jgi:oligopeptide transport system ATP-binding protein
MPPDLLNLPDGCAFAARCQKRTAECMAPAIRLEKVDDRHEVRCIHV